MQKIEICTCKDCGNETKKTLSCEWVDVDDPQPVKKKKEKKIGLCSTCGGETDTCIDDQRK